MASNRLPRDYASRDMSGMPEVNIEFDTEGAQKFAKLTTDNNDGYMAIVLDGVIQTAPHIEDQGHPIDAAPFQGEQLDHPLHHLGRQVVDTEIAHVLEGGHRLRLPRTRHAGDDGHMKLCQAIGHGQLLSALPPAFPPAQVHPSCLSSRSFQLGSLP